MNILYFYPTVTDTMLSEAGVIAYPYEYSFFMEGHYYELKAKGKSTIHLQDPIESWKIENDGMRIYRRISIEYPDVLKGKDGIVCKDAEIGACIVWTNRSLRQMGCIRPKEIKKSNGIVYYDFLHEFDAGEIKDDLTLETILYISKAAENVAQDERHLMNEEGVTVGNLDTVTINMSNFDMEFPIKEINDSSKPLWWIELEQWEDPTVDLFNEDYVCLYLNSYYNCCPKVGKTIKNIEILIEILSTAYLMIFQELINRDCLNKTLQDTNLEPGSIAKVMSYFAASCDPPLKTETLAAMQKSIHINIERMLRGDTEGEL